VIDFHCHLDLYPRPEAIRDECERRQIYVLSVTTTPSAWVTTASLAKSTNRIRTGLGLHPQLAHERAHEITLFDRFISETRYVGEIGLDGAPEFKGHWRSQLKVFEHVLAKCRDSGGRVMSIHSRRASAAVLDRIEEYQGAGIPILHWFSGSLRDLDRAIGLGCWFSVGPAMLVSENGKRIVQNVPRERLLTESDGPFAQLNGAPVMPWDVARAIHELSAMWLLTPEKVTKQIDDNLRSLLEQFA
jgi:TatD DNase family protein